MGEVSKEEYYRDNFSFVPKTKINFGDIIPNEGDIGKIEAACSMIRYLDLHEKTKNLGFGIERMKAIHGHLFQDVYDWAGKTRNFEGRKFSNKDSLFAHPSEFEDIYKDIENTLLESGWFEDHVKVNKTDFVEKISDIYSKINYAHIFPDGNGRASREYVRDLAEEAGFYLDFNEFAMSKEAKSEWYEASKAAFEGDKSKLKKLFTKITKENPLEVNNEIKPQTLIKQMQTLSMYGVDLSKDSETENQFNRNNANNRIIQEAQYRNQGTKKETDGPHP